MTSASQVDQSPLFDDLKKVFEEQRVAAIQESRAQSQKMIDEVLATLEKSNWDLDVAYPNPLRSMEKNAHKSAVAARRFAQRITSPLAYCRKQGESCYVVKNDSLIGCCLADAEQTAERNFLEFVAKIATKVGPATSVVLTYAAKNVWDYSLIVASYPDGSTKTLRTQRIVNRRGWTLYLQWPTRFVG